MSITSFTSFNKYTYKGEGGGEREEGGGGRGEGEWGRGGRRRGKGEGG